MFKALTGVQNFKSTLNFIRTMEPRASILSEEFKLGETTLQFLCFLMIVGKRQQFLYWIHTVGWGSGQSNKLELEPVQMSISAWAGTEENWLLGDSARARLT